MYKRVSITYFSLHLLLCCSVAAVADSVIDETEKTVPATTEQPTETNQVATALVIDSDIAAAEEEEPDCE